MQTEAMTKTMDGITRDQVREALEQAEGRVQAAAQILEVHYNQLWRALNWGPLDDLAKYAEQLRKAAGYTTGRPRALSLSRAEVAAAWEKAEHNLSAAAKALGCSRNGLRSLIHLYGLPDPPAPRRRR